MSNRTCPHCGAPIKETDLFCDQCGEKLTKTCPQCGTTVVREALYCNKCGYSFSEKDEEKPVSKEDIKKPKNPGQTTDPLVRKWWFWAVLLALLAIILSFTLGGPAKNNASPESEVTSETGEITEKEDPDSGTVTMEAFREDMDEVLEDAYGEDHFETQLDPDKKMYYIYVWMEDVTEALEKAREGDEELIQDWNALVGLLLESCDNIRNQMDEADLDDWSVSMNLLDEETKSEVYVITKDGEIYYDILTDKTK